MIKKLIITLVLLCAPVCLAQTTQVSGTITDSAGSPYANGTYNIFLTDNNGNYLSSGVVWIGNSTPVAPLNFTGALDGNGSFSVPLAQNAQIQAPSPATGTLWQFNICSAVPPPPGSSTYSYLLIGPQKCLKYSTTVSGSTLSLSTQLSALAQPIYYFNALLGRCEISTGLCGVGSGSSPPNFSVQFAAGTGFGSIPNITETPTTGSNGTFNLGPVPSGSTTAPNTSYGLYSGLPTMMNVMTDCPKLTGLAVKGIGNSANDDWAAVQACIWQRAGICAVGSGVCTPTDNRFATTGSTSVTLVFPQRQFNQSFGAGGLTPPLGSSTPASYYFSQSLDVPWGVSLVGDGAGESGNGTTLWFAAGAGIYMRGFSNIEHFSLVGSSCWLNTSLPTFVLPSGWGGSGPAVSGISAGSQTHIEDMIIRCFDMHGVSADSNETWPSPDTANESDEVSLKNVTASFNRGSGFYFNGGDGGVGHCDRCEGRDNQLYGAYDDSEFQDEFTAYLGDGNHTDGTGYSGTVPAGSSVSCTSTVCTFTTSSAHGLNPGDCVSLSGFNYTPLNTNFCEPGLTTASGSTFTLPNPTTYTDSETVAFTTHYSLGEHVWAAAGNTVIGTNAAGGCIFGQSGNWIMPYCEGNQNPGSFMAKPAGTMESVVMTPIGNASGAPFSSGTQQGTGFTITKGAYDLAYNVGSAVQLDGFDSQGAILQIFTNNTPLSFENQQISGIYNKSWLRRTFTGAGLNGSSNNSNWNCFMYANSYNAFMVPMAGCFGDQTQWPITSCTITNGGSGYTSPFLFAKGGNGVGAGATFSVTNTGGVLSNCVVVTQGAGYNSTASIQIFDSTGSGATATATTSTTGAYTDTGRSGITNAGVWYMPNWMALGNLANYQPAMVIGTGTAAPSSGSWKVGDTVINTSPSAGGIWGWQNTTAGSPGTWTPLVFAGSGFTGTKTAGSCVLTISGGLITNITGC